MLIDEVYQLLHRYGPEFDGDDEGNNGLTNHGPMAAEVILRRGLDLDVARWLDGYVRRLEDLPSAGDRITEQTWPTALGNGKRIGDWTAYFAAEVNQSPWQQVLATWWPRLLPGIVAGSTHGVIRVGHAVRALSAPALPSQSSPAQSTSSSGEPGPETLAELAHGLALWAARSRPLPGSAAPTGRLSAAAALADLPRLDDQTGLIALRLDRLAHLRGWPAALMAIRAPTDPAETPARLTELIDAALLHYLGHGRSAPVLLVHIATAPNAVLHTLPSLPENMWMRSFGAAWAATAAVVATYSPAVPQAAEEATASGVGQSASPTDVLDRAAWHGDEHVLKLSDTAVEAYDRTGDRQVLTAAHLAADLIPRPRFRTGEHPESSALRSTSRQMGRKTSVPLCPPKANELDTAGAGSQGRDSSTTSMSRAESSSVTCIVGGSSRCR